MPSLGPPRQLSNKGPVKRCVYRDGKPCSTDCAKYDEKYQTCADLAIVMAARQLAGSIDQLLNHLIMLVDGMYEEADFVVPRERPTFTNNNNCDDDVPF